MQIEKKENRKHGQREKERKKETKWKMHNRKRESEGSCVRRTI